ncbi:MAG TPA: hypothetical protein VF767_03330 [Bryobacteraceae bacterium]
MVGKLVARDSFTDHISDDLLETYALGKLQDADLAFAEEHMLVCAECRDRLVGIEAFVSVLRNALNAGKRKSGHSRAACGGGSKI